MPHRPVSVWRLRHVASSRSRNTFVSRARPVHETIFAPSDSQCAKMVTTVPSRNRCLRPWPSALAFCLGLSSALHAKYFGSLFLSHALIPADHSTRQRFQKVQTELGRFRDGNDAKDTRFTCRSNAQGLCSCSVAMSP